MMTAQVSTPWRPVPLTVCSAAAGLFVDAALTCLGPLLINAPIVYGLLVDRPSPTHPDPIRELLPLIIGSLLWLVLAAGEGWSAIMVRRAKPWAAPVASALLTVGLALAIVFPTGDLAAGILALPFGYALVVAKSALWLWCVAMLWLPRVSRDYFQPL